jgi:outer membrane lipoprotein LolB
VEDSFHIRLSGPLGTGTTIISGNDTGAKLESSSEGTFIAESPEQLLCEHTGWYLPLHNLLYWIKGLPEPRLPAVTEFDERGYLSRLVQGPWQLDFDRYQSSLDVTLPHKIKIYNEDLKVTLVIKQWATIEES